MGFFDSKADRLNEMALEFIEEGDELKEEYQRLFGQAEKKANDMEASFRAEVEYKNQVLNELGNDIQLSMERFKKVSIDNNILANISPELPDIDKGGLIKVLESISPLARFGSGSVVLLPGGVGFGLVNIITKMIHNAEAEDKAYRNHQNAREYMYKMDKAVEQAKNVLIGMDAIENLIKDEHDTIEKLMSKLRKLKNILSINKKDAITKADADYLKSLYAIAKKIQESLNRKIVDDKGKIVADYNKYCSDLKNINGGLPSTPELNDGKTEKWLELIAGSVVAYQEG